jgi:hypothetical protein
MDRFITISIVPSNWFSLELALRRLGLRMWGRRRRAGLLRFVGMVFFTMLGVSVSSGLVLVMLPSAATPTFLLASLLVLPPRGQAAQPCVAQLCARTAVCPATPWPPAAAMSGT